MESLEGHAELHVFTGYGKQGRGEFAQFYLDRKRRAWENEVLKAAPGRVVHEQG